MSGGITRPVATDAIAVTTLILAAVQNHGRHSMTISAKWVKPHATMNDPNATTMLLKGSAPPARVTTISSAVGIVI